MPGAQPICPVDDIIQQVNKLERSGHAEIVLTGIHIGQYGQEWKDGTDLLALLKKIEASGFRGRLRLGSVEPTELSPAFYQYVLRQEWICPHFHIPLQAGDDTILRQMNRHYTTAFYRQLVDDIRRSSADAAIGLDIITGFPGETDGQFERTLQFLNELPFTHLHVFPFSRRSGTPAAIMPNQIAGDVIKERARLLRQLGEENTGLTCGSLSVSRLTWLSKVAKRTADAKASRPTICRSGSVQKASGRVNLLRSGSLLSLNMGWKVSARPELIRKTDQLSCSA